MHYKIDFIGRRMDGDEELHVLIFRPTGSCGNIIKDQLFQSYMVGLVNGTVSYCKSLGSLQNFGLKNIRAEIFNLKQIYEDISHEGISHPLGEVWNLLEDTVIDMTFSVLQGRQYGN